MPGIRRQWLRNERAFSCSGSSWMLLEPVKWLAFNVLAPIGWALGYRAVHEYVPPSDDTTGDAG